MGLAAGEACVMAGPWSGSVLEDACDGTVVGEYGTGSVLAGGSDLDHDGVPDLIVGHDDGVYLIAGRPVGVVDGPTASWGRLVAGSEPGKLFEEVAPGPALALIGDWDDDGYDDLLVSTWAGVVNSSLEAARLFDGWPPN